MRFRCASALALAAMLAVLIGCSGTETTINRSNPPAPQPTNPPGGGGNGSPASSTFIVSISGSPSATGTVPAGQLSIASNADSKLSVTGLAASTSYILEFCRFPLGDMTNCPTVASFKASSSGAVSNLGFNYPNKGTFMGAFTIVNTKTNTADAISAWEQVVPNAMFQALLVPAGQVNGFGGGTFTPGSDSLKSGSVTANNTTVQITLSGAPANTQYNITVCGNMDASSCFFFATVTTDMSGNVSQSFPMTPDGPIDDFLINRASTDPTVSGPTQFVSAFTVQ
jgi:hypothetical protein